MKLYTKRGDDGSTDLFGGRRVLKSDVRVAAYGEVDAANAAIGLALAACADDELAEMLRAIQSDLFILGAELATPDGETPKWSIDAGRITQLEQWIDRCSSQTPPLGHFILPGGTDCAARLHLARAVCRRAERAVVALSAQQSVGAQAMIYLNRLSDLLFAAARLANHRAGVAETQWIAPAP